MTSVTARLQQPMHPRLSRRSRRVVVVGLLLAVLAAAAVQVAAVDWTGVLTGLQWRFVGLAALAAVVSVVGAAWNLIGFSPSRIGLWSACLAQLAGSTLKVVTPASVGTVAVNARLVHRSGTATAPAVVAVAASQAAQLVVTLAVVLGVAISGGALGPLQPHLPGTALAGGAVVVLAVAVSRRWWWRLVPGTATARLTEIGPQLLAVVRNPRRVLPGFGGCLLLTAGLVGTLWVCIRATGGSLPLLPVLVVLLAGSALGSTVPTPGGVGGVEAAMTAGLVAAGLPLVHAVPAVVLYRALTFWLLVPLGMLAAARLRHRSLL